MITKEFVEEKYVKWVNTCNKGGDTDPCYMNTFFYLLFGTLPTVYRFYIDDYGKIQYILEEERYIKNFLFNKNYYLNVKSINKVFQHYYSILNIKGLDNSKLYISDSVIIDSYIIEEFSTFRVFTDKLDIVDNISKLPFEIIKNNEEKPVINWLTYSKSGFAAISFDIKENYNLDVSIHYNDSLPYENLLNFCKEDKCGLTLLHGNPGCGKTTLIKNLIYQTGKNFYMLDADMLANSSNAAFVEYLIDHKNSIFVIEDCEKLLMDRATSNNPWIGTLLNLTDGMLGEGLGIRFICTFNSDISTIDKALLREGRLAICYELKPLCKEKAKVLCKKENREFKNRDMSLAEIFKSKILDTKLNKPIKRIGF